MVPKFFLDELVVVAWLRNRVGKVASDLFGGQQLQLVWIMWLLVLQLMPNVKSGENDVCVRDDAHHAKNCNGVGVEVHVFTFFDLAKLAERKTWVGRLVRIVAESSYRLALAHSNIPLRNPI